MTERGGLALDLSGVGRHFEKLGGRVEVFGGLTLHLDAGERVSIVGKSGVGKSTLLHLIGLLDRPDDGQITHGGIDLGQESESARARFRSENVSFIFQFHHLLSEFDAVENVVLPALLAGLSMSDARARAIALLERVGLGDRLAHQPGELSGGEQQRVAVARALVNRPALVLADEPTGNLDSRTAGEIHDLLLSMSEETGSTLVVVTHSDALATRLPRRLRLTAEGIEEIS